MKTLIIYNSKTGFTKKYVQWLSEEIDCTLIAFPEAGTADFSSYDTVIFASWFHAGRIKELNWFKKQPLTCKNKIVLATGATPADSPETQNALLENFKDNRTEYTPFYVQGGLCYEKMGTADKLLMSLFKKMVKKSAGENSEMYRMISHSYDMSKKENLEPLISYLKSLM